MTPKKLIAHLEGYAHSLRMGWMTPEEVAGNLFIIAEKYGRLVRVGEIYLKLNKKSEVEECQSTCTECREVKR